METSRKQLIGDNGCSPQDIVREVRRAFGPEQVPPKLTELAHSLGCDPVDINNWAKTLDRDSTLWFNILIEILTWRRQIHTTEATLENLIETLEAIHLNSIADHLRGYFKIPKNVTEVRDNADLDQQVQNSKASERMHSASMPLLGDNYTSREGRNAAGQARDSNPNKLNTLRILWAGIIIAFLSLCAITGVQFLYSPISSKSNKLESNVELGSKVDTTPLQIFKTENPNGVHSLPFAKTISSYSEYKEATENVNSQDIFLKICLSESLHWPDNSILFNSHLIKTLSIEGPISLTALRSLLSQVSRLAELELINGGEKTICEAVKGQKISMSDSAPNDLQFKHLTKLVFLNFTTCKEIYDIFSSVNLPSLSKIRLIHSDLTDLNIIQIQKTLFRSYASLSSIEIRGRKFTTKQFYTSPKPLENVEEIKLDLDVSNVIGAENDELAIDNRFSDTFPNLKYFKSRGNLSSSEFMRVLNCSKLSSVEVTVTVNKTELISKSNFNYSGTDLTYLGLVLLFVDSKCPTKSEFNRFRFQKLTNKADKFCAWSNCRIDFTRSANNVNGNEPVNFLHWCSIRSG